MTEGSRLTPGALAMVVVAVLFGLGILLLVVGAFVYPPVQEMPAAFDWTVTIGVFLGLVAIHGFLLREEDRLVLKLVLMCFFFVPTALALSVGGVMTLNGYLDRGALTQRTAVVLDTQRVRSSTRPAGPTHRLQVQAWRPGDSDPWIEVHRDLYNAVAPGTSAVGVTTKPGRLGIEWVVEVHADPAGD